MHVGWGAAHAIACCLLGCGYCEPFIQSVAVLCTCVVCLHEAIPCITEFVTFQAACLHLSHFGDHLCALTAGRRLVRRQLSAPFPSHLQGECVGSRSPMPHRCMMHSGLQASGLSCNMSPWQILHLAVAHRPHADSPRTRPTHHRADHGASTRQCAAWHGWPLHHPKGCHSQWLYEDAGIVGMR